jgi:hypothetical protein
MSVLAVFHQRRLEGPNVILHAAVEGKVGKHLLAHQPHPARFAVDPKTGHMQACARHTIMSLGATSRRACSQIMAKLARTVPTLLSEAAMRTRIRRLRRFNRFSPASCTGRPGNNAHWRMPSSALRETQRKERAKKNGVCNSHKQTAA